MKVRRVLVSSQGVASQYTATPLRTPRAEFEPLHMPDEPWAADWFKGPVFTYYGILLVTAYHEEADEDHVAYGYYEFQFSHAGVEYLERLDEKMTKRERVAYATRFAYRCAGNPPKPR